MPPPQAAPPVPSPAAASARGPKAARRAHLSRPACRAPGVMRGSRSRSLSRHRLRRGARDGPEDRRRGRSRSGPYGSRGRRSPPRSPARGERAPIQRASAVYGRSSTSELRTRPKATPATSPVRGGVRGGDAAAKAQSPFDASPNIMSKMRTLLASAGFAVVPSKAASPGLPIPGPPPGPPPASCGWSWPSPCSL